MIRKHHSLEKAETVVKVLNDIILTEYQEEEGKEISDNCHIESFDNCREQGLVIKCGFDSLNIAICEHRNSDSIRIWVYTKAAFPSNLMSDDDDGDAYDKSFGYNKYYEAAKFIVRLLNKEVHKKEKEKDNVQTK